MTLSSAKRRSNGCSLRSVKDGLGLAAFFFTATFFFFFFVFFFVPVAAFFVDSAAGAVPSALPATSAFLAAAAAASASFFIFAACSATTHTRATQVVSWTRECNQQKGNREQNLVSARHIGISNAPPSSVDLV